MISDQLEAAVRQAERDGMTLYRISKDSGLNPSVLQRFMAGETNLRLPTVDALCRTLNLELRPIRGAGRVKP